MHNVAFQAMGEDLVYVAFEVGLDRIASAMEAFRTLGARGGDVTMPFKQAAARLMDRLTSVALLAGAVNTIVNEDGVLTGHNTDGEGYLRALEEAGVQYVGKKFTMLGAGGASAAIAVQAAIAGARAIALFNHRDRFFANAQRIAAELRSRFGCDAAAHDLGDTVALKREMALSDIFVNGTPVGMGSSRENASFRTRPISTSASLPPT
jgi:shikimate dehydrogenase